MQFEAFIPFTKPLKRKAVSAKIDYKADLVFMQTSVLIPYIFQGLTHYYLLVTLNLNSNIMVTVCRSVY